MNIERLVVLVSADGDSHLLGVPALKSSSGADQMQGVMKLIEEYDLKLNITGLCLITLSSNYRFSERCSY